MPSDETADDGYEPALDSTTTAETSTESEPVVKRGMSPAMAAAAETPKIGEPVADTEDHPGIEQGPRAPRVRSERNRAMFRDLVAKVQAGEVDTGGDLEPMTHSSPPAAAAPAAAASPSAPAVANPPAAAAAAPLAPIAVPAGLPPLPLTPLPATPSAAPAPVEYDSGAAAAREAAIAAREAAVAAREKLMPDSTALAERGAAAFVPWFRESLGITDDAEMRTALTDFVTELSEVSLGVKLPDEVKTLMESRKALRSVKAYKASLDKREQSLSEQRAAQEKAAAEARNAQEQSQRDAAYVSRIGELIAPARETYKFLFDPEVTNGLAAPVIVYEVLKEQKRLGHTPDLATATEYANNYYKAHAEAEAKKAARFQSLLAPATPAPAAAPAKAATSPGGAPGPVPTTPKTPAPEEWDPSDLPMDRQQRRQASLAKLIAARKAAPQSA